jgi:cation transport ATPase
MEAHTQPISGRRFIPFAEILRGLKSGLSRASVVRACTVAVRISVAIFAVFAQATRRKAITENTPDIEQPGLIGTIMLDKAISPAHGNAEVIAILPRPSVTEAELLSVAASAERFSETPSGRAILRKANLESVPLIESDDFHEFPGGGVHCWMGHLPTLVGSREFLVRLGIDLADCPGDPGVEIFVAQGTRVLGKIQISVG